MNTILDVAVLYALGLLGWQAGKKLHIPAPHVLGGIILIGSMRIAGIPLPPLPQFLIIFLQIGLGVMIGGKFSGDIFASLKKIARPALFISLWALGITFLAGFFIYHFSQLDLETSILCASIGGLPEMTILALATGADPVVVVIFHVFRIITTILLFPIIFKILAGRENSSRNNKFPIANQVKKDPGNKSPLLIIVLRALGTFTVAGAAGYLAILLNVPAGGLVGSLLITIIAQLLNLPLYIPPPNLLNWLLVGVGIMVTNYIEPATMATLASGELVLPIIISLILTISSSLIMALLISKYTDLKFQPALLASAPSGFTIMTGLAFQTNNDPLKVSMLHLCRLLTLKLTIPFLFMLFY